MTIQELESRLRTVEVEVAELKRRVPGVDGAPGWLQKFIGAFDNKPEYDEIVRYGEEFRRTEGVVADEEPEA
ncbi:hypothetical protein SAMN05421753_10680 [Planctomicrobium piriforme]|uniref:Uncharacterized protein n=2 Tax=Planctomicrobium piriforme TaxID=1576369 RepID=A0A1I3FXS2_9PLAN|nr:hypothetical protein SAMN05421753_10680 [Planctomicrobium piriforme]